MTPDKDSTTKNAPSKLENCEAHQEDTASVGAFRFGTANKDTALSCRTHSRCLGLVLVQLHQKIHGLENATHFTLVDARNCEAS